MTKEEIIAEGTALDDLTNHQAWGLFVKKLEDRALSLQRKHDNVVHDLNSINYDNGRRRGLYDALSIVQKAIQQKDEALAKEDAEGG